MNTNDKLAGWQDAIREIAADAGVNNWQPISTAPLNTKILTKIDDENGPRNEQSLIAKKRDPASRCVMWWFPDMSMYVYYTPTHWRHL